MIVVTGASGFIGSNLVAALNRGGRSDVIAVDDYPDIRGPVPTEATSALRYADRIRLKGAVDLRDLFDWLDRDGSAIEAVVHLGACSDTTVSDREFLMSRNFEYTRTLWQWCTEAQCPLVYASSAATYGDGSKGYDDQTDQRTCDPLNLYGESKHLFDIWALGQSRTPPRWAGVKYFNVYGPNEDHKGRMASVAFHAFHQIMKTGQVRLFQSHRADIPHGAQRRDFVHVVDAVDATLHLLNTPVSDTTPNGLYNVGTGQARTFADLARALFAALEREPNISYIPMPMDLRKKYQYFTEARMTKLRRSGFRQPFRSIEQGVFDYVRGYLLPVMRKAPERPPATGDVAA